MKLLQNIILIILLLSTTSLQAQQKYWVYFKDKKGVDFDPFTYFDSKAIDRRIKHKIPISHKSDYPLQKAYVNKVSEMVDSVGYQSRWLNAVSVWSSPSQIDKLLSMDCVLKVELQQLIPCLAYKTESKRSKKTEKEFILDKQIKSLEGQLFEGSNIKGEGVRVAVFDAGFPNVDIDTAFAHIRGNNRIIKTFDFTKNKEHVYYSNTHGTMVLSNIAGKYYGNRPMGVATDAEFLLAKTEVGTEPFAEEEYWLAAMEWADKNGADIINSSLGYTHHRYFRDQMDGSSLVAKAGNIAYSKGILVVNAAGNEGSTSFWKYIGTPADADSVLSIGGIDPYTDYHISFSSYGPTADGRMKPNVSAMGTALVISKNGPQIASGTSFASPLVAGFAACVLQMNPDYTVSELFKEIQKSSSLYPYYDYAHGYGIPKASYFTNKPKQGVLSTFRFEAIGDKLKIQVMDHSNRPTGQKNYMYYHISNPEGLLKFYELIDVYQKEALVIDLSDYEKGDVIRVHFQSYTSEYIIK